LRLARSLCALGAFALLSACATNSDTSGDEASARAPVLGEGRGPWIIPVADSARPRAVYEGLASWYGARFQGRLTANGEVFDQHALTAAHPTLPLPSLARVTRLDTGESVVVRVNDRGPFVEGRIIDLSFAAANELDFVEDGVAEVLIEALGPADVEDRAAPPMAFDPAEGPPRFDAETLEPIQTAQR
jgi:rare lipoprotein A